MAVIVSRNVTGGSAVQKQQLFDVISGREKTFGGFFFLVLARTGWENDN